MTLILKRLFTALLALLVATPLAFAQVQRNYAQVELDQMLAPVALYPDPLLSQILMAATYPRDVIEAADWSRANPGLQGDDAVRAAQNEDWDPSVKSLVAFPQLLARMDEKLEWTQALGDAFLAQETQVMDTVQQLRRRARAAGNLQSSEQLHVQEQGPTIQVQLASPQYLYVPYYDPMVVYGSWWWPSYPPVVWAPWPGYARPYRSGANFSFWWGTPIRLSANFFFGNFDWHQRHVRVVQVNNYYYRPPVVVNRTVVMAPGRWQHDPHHRRDVVYRDAAVRERFVAARQERAHDRNERPQTQPQTPSVTERRADRREERREERQAAPAQAQPQAPSATERRADRRDDRRAERQAAPAQPQPAAQPRAEQRDDRRADRQAAMEAQRQAQQQAQQQARQQAQEAQRQVQQQAQQQARQQAQEAQRQAQQQARQKAQEAQRQQHVREQRERPQAPPAVQPQAPQAAQPQARMPAAATPPQEPKRHEARDDRDHGKRGNGRS